LRVKKLMQESLLDIFIVGLLVLVFAVIQRRRSMPRIRYWTLGWIFILLHFTLQIVVQDVAWQSVLGVSALLLAGCSFLIASSDAIHEPGEAMLAAGLLGVPPIAYLCLTVYGVSTVPVLVAVALVGQLCMIYVSLRYWGADRGIIRGNMLIAIVILLWIAYEIRTGQAILGVYGTLTEIFAINAWFYWRDFRRASAGVMTAVLGLLAWALVFPAALLVSAWWPHLQVSGELWNIPKYFVEFGMILTLLEEEIQAANRTSEDYRVLFESNPSPMWIYDLETLRFLRVNDAAQHIYGYSEEEFRQMTLLDIRPQEEVPRMLEDVGLERAEMVFSGPWTHVYKDGRQSKVEVAAHTIHFNGRMARFCLVVDVTEREELHRQLLYQAHHDLLTGLPNRLLLKDRMQQTLTRASRQDRRVAFVCIDLDRFKQINDNYGHLVGDQCLKLVAERLRRRLRGEDTIARSGGEEFVAVLGELKSRQDAYRVAEDLLYVFHEPFLVEGYRLELPASIGVALYPDDGTDAGDLWRNADIAMYRSKKSGGNRFTFVSDEISSAAAEANDLELMMRTALKEGGFEVYYQPQYLADGQLCGMEALLRLHHPKNGLILPDRFIPVAEDSGLIMPIGNWVLEEVARQFMAWSRAGLPQVRIAVNVSPLQFMHSDFMGHVQRVLARSGMPAELLELEVTETTVMRNIEEIARQMRELAALGVHFSVDDFGTGYSSLRHLHQLPIKTLKVDRSFVERITETNGTHSIVQAILSLAHSLGMQVVAEGVERKDQFELLKALQCDVFQGYLFSYPLEAGAIPPLLETQTAEVGES
jgi:diguanylate cyclase (GGDEF)-like protein/PAS domain S-box-containing protein